MNLKFTFIFLVFTPITLLRSQQNQMDFLPEKIVVDEYHGQKVKDPYRYAEDLNLPIVKNWIAKQNEISTAFFHKIKKKKDLIDQQIEFDQKKASVISKLVVTENDHHFYLKRLPNENVPKLYYRKTFSGKEVLLYDAKDFNPNSNIEYVINYIKPSWNGSKIIISLTKKGKEISEMVIMDVASQKVAPAVIQNVWPTNNDGVNWLPDNSGFTYVHYPSSDPTSIDFLHNTKSVIYKLGQDPKKNKQEIFSKTNNPNLNLKKEDYPITVLENKDCKYLIGITPGAGSYYNSYYLPIKELTTKNWKPLFSKSEQIKDMIVVGDSLIYQTSKNAPNFKICSTSIENPDFDNPKVLVPERKHEVITDFDINKDGLFFVTSKNGVKATLFKQKNATQIEIKLPQVYGDLAIESKGVNHNKLWITASGWTTDNLRFEYSEGNLVEKNLSKTHTNQLIKDIIIEEVEVEAHDGEKIPLSILYKKGIQKNKNNYVLMDGYGAYGISMKPTFSLRRLLWVLEGGIFAISHVRGGGEKGDAWHKGGYKSKKPNTWKDFISCAEYLIKNDYTVSKKLAVWSGSAGGIMIGRAITDRPDLFAAAIIEFGSLNMLRSEMRANGATNIKEFGALKYPEEFKGLYAMDAYQHIKHGEKYPATLLAAGLNDARVPAWFSVKFAAKMQRSNTSGKANLLLINKDTGHGVDDTKLKSFNRFATVLCFAFWQTGHPDYQPN